jgi:peptide/nickel transport system permease protein
MRKAQQTARTGLKGPLFRWLGRTAASVLPVTAGVVAAVFLLLRIVPGDPARMILGERATEESVRALRLKLGLDDPLGKQFADFAAALFTRGDTGVSLVFGVSARTLIFSRAPVTLLLAAAALVIAVLIAAPLAVAAAVHKDGILDHGIRVLSIINLGMPAFWFGIMLIALFAVKLRWFPAGGAVLNRGFPAALRSLFLPACTVALAQIPPLIRSLRAEVLEVLGSNFVVTLRAAGLPPRVILYRHVLRNAALPTLMLLGVNAAYLIGGTLVIERVFDIDGIGSLLFKAISNRDFPVVQGIAFYSAVMVTLLGLLVEVFARIIDPRKGAP